MKQIYLEKTTYRKGQICAFIAASKTNHLIGRDKKLSCANIFLSQNLGKAPPGKADRLDVADCHCLVNSQVLVNQLAVSNLYISCRDNKIQITNHLNIKIHN